MSTSVQSELTPPYLGAEGITRYAGGWGEDEVAPETTILSKKRNREQYSLLTKCIAEFLGDFTFVFVGTMQAYVTVGPTGMADNIVHAALTHGFAIFLLVASLGHISGGHFNPAVSWSITCLMKMPWWHFPFYMFSQLLGGFCGALVTALVMSQPELDSTHAGATLLSPKNQWWEGLISEAVVTFFLCHTILNAAVDTDKNVLAPLAIGLTLSIDILATGDITGASMNPARSLGPNIVGQIFCTSDTLPPNFWNYHYIYWAGPFAGATAASLVHKLFEQREDRLLR